jgi:hypothetical protein
MLVSLSILALLPSFALSIPRNIDHSTTDETILHLVGQACVARCERPATTSVNKACDEFRGDSRFPQRLSICQDSYKAGHRHGCELGCNEGSANDVCFGIAAHPKFLKAREATCASYDQVLPRPTMINVCRQAFTKGAETRCSDSLSWSREEYSHLLAKRSQSKADTEAKMQQELQAHLFEAAAAEQRRLAQEAREQAAREAAAAEEAERKRLEAEAEAAKEKAAAEAAAAAAKAAEEARKGKTRGFFTSNNKKEEATAAPSPAAPAIKKEENPAKVAESVEETTTTSVNKETEEIKSKENTNEATETVAEASVIDDQVIAESSSESSTDNGL